MTNPISDILEAETILVIGSNTTEAHPIVALKIKKAVVEKGAKLIVIDPRKIRLVEFADLWLSQKPGTNIALNNSLAHVILREGLIDEKFIKTRTEKFESLKKVLKKYTPEFAEKITGVPANLIEKAARLYGEADRATLIYTMGIAEFTTGYENVLSVANLAMMTGNIGRVGTGVNPLRGQNNVQGACDMGALPDTYPGYQKIDDSKIKEKFEKGWGRKLSKKPGLTLVEMMRAAEKREIKAMYIVGENPMLSDPDTTHVEKALKKLDFLVVQDIFLTETAELADVVLPATSFAEKDGSFTNTERRIQRVRKAIEPIGDSKPDWQIISDLSNRMGYPMSYANTSKILEEMASLTPICCGVRHERIEEEGLCWPCPDLNHKGTPILHTETFTRGLGYFSPVEFKPPAEKVNKNYPLILTTGRILYHYHTGSMTRRSKGLSEHVSQGDVEVSPKDASRHKISDGEMVYVISRRGKVKARVKVTDKSPEGTVFMSFHFTEMPTNILTNSASDSVTKTPEFKFSAVRIEKIKKR